MVAFNATGFVISYRLVPWWACAETTENNEPSIRLVGKNSLRAIAFLRGSGLERIAHLRAMSARLFYYSFYRSFYNFWLTVGFVFNAFITRSGVNGISRSRT